MTTNDIGKIIKKFIESKESAIIIDGNWGIGKTYAIDDFLKIEKDKEYSILLTDTIRSILEKTIPGCRIKQLQDMTLSSAWTAFMEKGQQPLAPEDYIEVEK